MKYTLTTYRDGKKAMDVEHSEAFMFLWGMAYAYFPNVCDEYEITNEHGHIVAYAMTEDSPKAIQANSERAQSRKEAQADRMADIARDIQREELASRQAQRGSR